MAKKKWLKPGATKDRTANPIHPDDSSGHEGSGFHAKLPAVPHVPPPPGQGKGARGSGYESAPWWKKWLEIGAFLIGLAVAVIYYFQFRSMQASVDLARQTAQIDQRPYVWDSNIKPQTTIAAGQRMWANIHIINFGKSPALKARIIGTIFIGPNAKKDADAWFALLGDKEFTDPSESETVIPPGIPSVTPESEKSGAGFGGGGYFTIMGEKVLTQPDVDYVLNTEESAVIVARIQYFDGFGNRYWSNICLSRFVSGAAPHCTRHNEIH